MAINSINFAQNFTGELDKLLVSEAKTGFMTDNAFRAKFVGAHTVLIPDISFQGLGDYDRDTGFITGTTTVSNTAYTLKQDRARSFQIDREDMDETGVANLAGQVLGEFVRTRVVPECDAYVLSKLCGLANSRGQLLTDGDTSKPYASFNRLMALVQGECGYDSELVCFVSPAVWNSFLGSEEISRQITVSEFRQGQVQMQVSSINGVTIIPVPASRMQSAYQFLSGGAGAEEGGFAVAEGAKGICMLMLPKSAASLVRKSEKMRIFSPDKNPKADAYQFDYRLYYDVFVKTSYASGVWAWMAPEVTVETDLDEGISMQTGDPVTLSVTATVSDGSTPEYQWYSCKDSTGKGALRIAGENGPSMQLGEDLPAGAYYYFVRITGGGSTVRDSAIAAVTVA
ncbi:MAG: hypothetical protein E7486_07455 [Ruminococcaceae bacterium]|nr:hypothetical protein [Oscillospiraceae bacterium]